MNIIYTTDSSVSSDIYAHLIECKDQFIPALDITVDIRSYAEKLFKLSTTFEAWDDSRLVGILAAYTNDPAVAFAYISNLSILNTHLRVGIASKLIESCKKYCVDLGFRQLRLEVNKSNLAAEGTFYELDFEISYKFHMLY